MKARPGWHPLIAGASALVLNFVLFTGAALLARDRTIVRDDVNPIPVSLVAMPKPEMPEPEPVKDLPPPEQAERPRFVPDLARPSAVSPPGVPEIRINIDPSLFSGTSVRPDVAFEASELDQPPRQLMRQSPVYPFKAKQRNIEGFVEVKLLVEADGSIGPIEVLASEPAGLFENAALKAVPAWKFEPGRLDGRPVASWVRTRIIFQLN